MGRLDASNISKYIMNTKVNDIFIVFFNLIGQMETEKCKKLIFHDFPFISCKYSIQEIEVKGGWQNSILWVKLFLDTFWCFLHEKPLAANYAKKYFLTP